MGDASLDKAYLHGKGLSFDEAVAFALDERAPEEKPQPSSWSVLTPREREIAWLVAKGLTNQAIADTLVISVRTAETHVEHILTKLGFNARSQIATWVAHSAES
jgi:DNA-binding NarL/FixJ family response regulator